MSSGFRELAPSELTDNPFRLIGSDWMLITAGVPGAFNMMTASWGGLGVLWERPVCFIFVRPTRHTFGLIERHDRFTLSFFDEAHRAALKFCGAHSGRNTDKAAATGLTPVAEGNEAVYFQEARLVMICRKIARQNLDPAGFLEESIGDFYPARDYHRLFVGEIRKVLAK